LAGIPGRILSDQLAGMLAASTEQRDCVHIQEFNTKSQQIGKSEERLSQKYNKNVTLLKGQSHEIFDPLFFSPIKSPYVTDYHPKIFLN
jgi:hypothetical protein